MRKILFLFGIIYLAGIFANIEIKANDITFTKKILKNANYQTLETIDNTPTFYINEETLNGDFAVNYNTNNFVDVEAFEVAKYNFIYDGLEYYGAIYANTGVLVEDIDAKIDEIVREIENDIYFSNISSRIANMNIAGKYSLLKKFRSDAVLNGGNKHYGDYTEWEYIFLTISGHYVVVIESEINPDDTKTDFRSNEFIYEFNMNNQQGVELLAFGPTSREPNDNNVTYSFSCFQAGIDVRMNYYGLADSPVVSYENNSNNYFKVSFNYLCPFDNKGSYYDYNISTSTQVTTYIIEATEGMAIDDKRVVSIVYDGFWSNKTCNFIISRQVELKE